MAFTSALGVLQVPRIARWRLRHRAIVLGYHGFCDGAVDSVLGDSGKHVSAAMFRRQLEYLRATHRVLSLPEFLRHCEEHIPLPSHSVVITIDDGYRSIHAVAFPILRELRMPATVFLTTDFVEHGTALWTDRIDYCLATAPSARVRLRLAGDDVELDLTGMRERIRALATLHARLTRHDPAEQSAAADALERATGCALGAADARPTVLQPLRWSEVAEMHASGLVTFGSHTRTHAILSRCDAARQRREIAESRAVIEARLGERCDLFCYPNGRREDFDADTRAALRELKFRAALTTIAGANDIRCDPLEIRRFVVSAREDFEGFVLKMYGVVNALSGVKRRLLSARE